MDARANEMMMLKFGRVVNLDALEGLTTNKVINELEKKVRGQERAGDRQMRALEVSREREGGGGGGDRGSENECLVAG